MLVISKLSFSKLLLECSIENIVLETLYNISFCFLCLCIEETASIFQVPSVAGVPHSVFHACALKKLLAHFKLSSVVRNTNHYAKAHVSVLFKSRTLQGPWNCMILVH
jgi:hypothetical protein